MLALGVVACGDVSEPSSEDAAIDIARDAPVVHGDAQRGAAERENRGVRSSAPDIARTGDPTPPDAGASVPADPANDCGDSCSRTSHAREAAAVSGRPPPKAALGVLDPRAPGALNLPGSDNSDLWLTRRGRQLWFGGKPYVAIGFNAFGMAGCETGRPYTDAQMDVFFASLRPYGLTRAWAFEAQGIAGVEQMVHWAERHSQLLILSLADGRGNCAEADGRAGGEGSGKTSDWYKSGYKQRYLPWLESVVGRFRNSPAIGMWELINEPGDTDDPTMRAFFDDAAAHVKAVDPRHLVLSGSQAQYVRGTSDYAYVHAGPDIDVASLHEYDYDYANSRTIMSPQLGPALDAMRTLDKPLIVGETGIQAGTDPNCTSYAARSEAVKQKLDTYLRQDGVVGVEVWSWVPKERTGCALESFFLDPMMAMIRSYR
jgi:mannan endo-1,4-beta-mannosidase